MEESDLKNDIKDHTLKLCETLNIDIKFRRRANKEKEGKKSRNTLAEKLRAAEKSRKAEEEKKQKEENENPKSPSGSNLGKSSYTFYPQLTCLTFI